MLTTIRFLSFSAKKGTDPDGKSINYEYDQDGRILKTIDGNGNKILMVYAQIMPALHALCAPAAQKIGLSGLSIRPLKKS